MTSKNYTYDDPTDFPIPDGTDQIGCLYINLERAEGVLVALRDGNDTSTLDAKALCCAVGLVRQASNLLYHWQAQDTAEKTKTNHPNDR